MTGLEYMEVSQEVKVDRGRRVFTTKSENVTWRDKISCDEECSYWADAQNPGYTRFQQTATMSVASDWDGFGLSSTIQAFLIDAYGKAIDKVSAMPAQCVWQSDLVRLCRRGVW